MTCEYIEDCWQSQNLIFKRAIEVAQGIEIPKRDTKDLVVAQLRAYYSSPSLEGTR